MLIKNRGENKKEGAHVEQNCHKQKLKNVHKVCCIFLHNEITDVDESFLRALTQSSKEMQISKKCVPKTRNRVSFEEIQGNATKEMCKQLRLGTCV